MNPNRLDFIRNPEIEKNIPPKGYDFWRAPEEEDQIAKNVVQPEPVVEEKPKDEIDTTIKVVLGNFKCNECNFESSTERGMKVHIGRRHKNECSGDGKEC
jgi:hypothetical protein